METLDALLEKLWGQYKTINAQAGGIHQLLLERGDQVKNDHIAFRTFNDPLVGIDAVAAQFLKFGYVEKGQYDFPAKKLNAKHFEHPDGKYPLVFISELRVEEFSESFQEKVRSIVAQVPKEATARWDFCVSLTHWKPLSHAEYEALKKESEYGAWLSVFGFQANHFTVLFNSLESFRDMQEFNAFIKDSGYAMNSSGGEIKGTPAEFLEQSSTLAQPVAVKFSDCEKDIPGCYYEFARRYNLPDGKLFTGFIAKSADKIFESTDNKE